MTEKTKRIVEYVFLNNVQALAPPDSEGRTMIRLCNIHGLPLREGSLHHLPDIFDDGVF